MSPVGHMAAMSHETLPSTQQAGRSSELMLRKAPCGLAGLRSRYRELLTDGWRMGGRRGPSFPAGGDLPLSRDQKGSPELGGGCPGPSGQ